MGDQCIQVSNLWVGYGKTDVIRGVSFDVARGAIVAFLGSNGSGKSTLMRGMAGVLFPSRGEIELYGKNIVGWSPRRLIQEGLAYVAQGRQCFPDLTIPENLMAAMLSLHICKSDLRQRIEESLETFPLLSQFAKEPVRRLSGGVQQILVVAMALCQRPKCMLLDEPSMGLSESLMNTLQQALKRFIQSGGAIVLSEQKPRVVFAIGDYAYYLDNGTISLHGRPNEIRQNQEFIQRYFGLRPYLDGPVVV